MQEDRGMPTHLDHHISYSDEEDDPEDLDARRFMTPLLLVLALVFVSLVAYVLVRA
jgi:hypothetical protein